MLEGLKRLPERRGLAKWLNENRNFTKLSPSKTDLTEPKGKKETALETKLSDIRERGREFSRKAGQVAVFFDQAINSPHLNSNGLMLIDQFLERSVEHGIAPYTFTQFVTKMTDIIDPPPQDKAKRFIELYLKSMKLRHNQFHSKTSAEIMDNIIRLTKNHASYNKEKFDNYARVIDRMHSLGYSPAAATELMLVADRSANDYKRVLNLGIRAARNLNGDGREFLFNAFTSQIGFDFNKDLKEFRRERLEKKEQVKEGHPLLDYKHLEKEAPEISLLTKIQIYKALKKAKMSSEDISKAIELYSTQGHRLGCDNQTSRAMWKLDEIFIALCISLKDEKEIITAMDDFSKAKDNDGILVTDVQELSTLYKKIVSTSKSAAEIKENFDQLLKPYFEFARRDVGTYFLKRYKALLYACDNLPSTRLALRNFAANYKADPPNFDAQLKELNQMLILSFAEMNRRGVEDARSFILARLIQSKKAYPLTEAREELRTKQINDVFDFGLDVFHGYEAFTQEARPIRHPDQWVTAPFLQRMLGDLADKSYRLNCSKEKHLDRVFPGPAMHFEGIKVPEKHKDFLFEDIPEESMDILKFKDRNYSALENTSVTITRGAIILSNPQILLPIGLPENLHPHSLIIYNDHFANEKNIVALLVPTDFVNVQIDPSKIEAQNYKGFDSNLPDMINSQLGAKTIKDSCPSYDPASVKTIRTGFGDNTDYSEGVYKAMMDYQDIFRKLQLTMSLYRKGYVGKNFTTMDLRPEFRSTPDTTMLMLNELFNWRDHYKNTDGHKASTPVLVDVDPFRISDARNWSFKVDPTAKEGIEISFKDNDHTIIIPDPPEDPEMQRDWLKDARTTWGAEIYSRIYNEALTKDLKLYNRSQV